MRDTPQILPFRSPERFPVPAGASNVSQNASGDVADCRVQELCAIAVSGSLHHAITLNAVIATRHTRLMRRRLQRKLRGVDLRVTARRRRSYLMSQPSAMPGSIRQTRTCSNTKPFSIKSTPDSRSLRIAKYTGFLRSYSSFEILDPSGGSPARLVPASLLQRYAYPLPFNARPKFRKARRIGRSSLRHLPIGAAVAGDDATSSPPAPASALRCSESLRSRGHKTSCSTTRWPGGGGRASRGRVCRPAKSTDSGSDRRRSPASHFEAIPAEEERLRILCVPRLREGGRRRCGQPRKCPNQRGHLPGVRHAATCVRDVRATAFAQECPV